MSDTVSLVLAALAAAITAFLASDPAGVSDTVQAVLVAVVTFLGAVAVKRPGREATALR